MFFRILSVSLLTVGMVTTAMAECNGRGFGGDRGGWGDSPGADDYGNYRNTITGGGDTRASARTKTPERRAGRCPAPPTAKIDHCAKAGQID